MHLYMGCRIYTVNRWLKLNTSNVATASFIPKETAATFQPLFTLIALQWHSTVSLSPQGNWKPDHQFSLLDFERKFHHNFFLVFHWDCSCVLSHQQLVISFRPHSRASFQKAFTRNNNIDDENKIQCEKSARISIDVDTSPNDFQWQFVYGPQSIPFVKRWDAMH